MSNTMKEVPIWEKSNLTVEGAAAYSGIGINKIKEISNSEIRNYKAMYNKHVYNNMLGNMKISEWIMN